MAQGSLQNFSSHVRYPARQPEGPVEACTTVTSLRHFSAGRLGFKFQVTALRLGPNRPGPAARGYGLGAAELALGPAAAAARPGRRAVTVTA
jgi:hypothetical protein